MRKITLEITPGWLVLVVCGVGVLAATNLLRAADGDPSTSDVPQVIPYHGTLEMDGIAVTGSITMGFAFYDTAAGSNWDFAGGAPGDVLWSTTRDVEVYGGEFSVLLGDPAEGDPSLATLVADAEPLFLNIVVIDGGMSVLRSLAGSRLRRRPMLSGRPNRRTSEPMVTCGSTAQRASTVRPRSTTPSPLPATQRWRASSMRRALAALNCGSRPTQTMIRREIRSSRSILLSQDAGLRGRFVGVFQGGATTFSAGVQRHDSHRCWWRGEHNVDDVHVHRRHNDGFCDVWWQHLDSARRRPHPGRGHVAPEYDFRRADLPAVLRHGRRGDQRFGDRRRGVRADDDRR